MEDLVNPDHDRLELTQLAHAVLDSQPQLTSSTHPPSIPQIMGVFLAVKPAVYIPNLSAPEAVLSRLRSRFGELEFVGSFLVNTSILKSRIRRDRVFLEKMGLRDADYKTILARANPEGTTLQENLLAGFVLGYPVSALQSFEKRNALQNRGVFDLDFLGFACSDEALMEQFGLAKEAHLKEPLLAFGTACEEQRRAHGFVSPAFFRTYKRLLAPLLRDHFHLSEEEIEFLFEQQYVDIEGVLGFGTAYPNAPDVQALRQEIQAALPR